MGSATASMSRSRTTSSAPGQGGAGQGAEREAGQGQAQDQAGVHHARCCARRSRLQDQPHADQRVGGEVGDLRVGETGLALGGGARDPIVPRAAAHAGAGAGPLPDVAVHVVEAGAVRAERADAARPGRAAQGLGDHRVGGDRGAVGGVAPGVGACAAGGAGEAPLRGAGHREVRVVRARIGGQHGLDVGVAEREGGVVGRDRAAADHRAGHRGPRLRAAEARPLLLGGLEDREEVVVAQAVHAVEHQRGGAPGGVGRQVVDRRGAARGARDEVEDQVGRGRIADRRRQPAARAATADADAGVGRAAAGAEEEGCAERGAAGGAEDGGRDHAQPPPAGGVTTLSRIGWYVALPLVVSMTRMPRS